MENLMAGSKDIEATRELLFRVVSTDKILPIWLRQKGRSFWANWASTERE